MRTWILLSATIPSLLGLGACVGADPGPLDEAGDVAVPGGKADGSDYSECQLAAVVAWLNEGPSEDELEAAGVNGTAAGNLVEHRDGADGRFGSADDDLFADIAEVDAVPYVGPISMKQLVAATAARCTAPDDGYAAARDVSLHRVTFPPTLAAPTDYAYPEGGQFDLSGTEFWQKWSGGHNPTYDFSEGTDAGRRCMQASAIRFETIMKEAPAELVGLLEHSNWTGSFFNWNDDYSMSSSDGSGAQLWAWRTGLIKWISQTNRDGSCWLPTLELVKQAAQNCRAAAESGAGEIQGCRS